MSYKNNNTIFSNPCSVVKAQYATVGIYDGGAGIISWHTNEFDAHKTRKAINSSGKGRVDVRRTPNGKMEHIKDEIMTLILEFQKEFACFII